MKNSLSLQNDLRKLYIGGVIGLFTLTITVLSISHYLNFNSTAKKVRTDYIQQQKKIIKREVHRITEQANYQKSILKKQAESIAKQRVEQAIDIINKLSQQDKNSSPQQLEQLIFSTLRAIRFDHGLGYFFIFSPDATELMNPIFPEREKQILNNLTDINGKSMSEYFNQISQSKSDAVVTYYFTKPKTLATEYEKTSYLKYINKMGWIIGTGIYTDELEKKLKQNLLSEIQNIRYSDNGYIFVDDWSGVVLAHGAQPGLVGKNIWNYEDPNGVMVVQRLIEAAKTENGDYIYYSWKKPDSGIERPKISFSAGIHDWQWMIGSGVYVDEIDEYINELYEKMLSNLLSSLLITLSGGFIIALWIYRWGRVFYHRIETDLEKFQNFFGKLNLSNSYLDDNNFSFLEHNELATHVNKMLVKKQEAERRLKDYQVSLEQLVQERTISLEQKNKELVQLATTDLLTGLCNRRNFIELAQQQLKELARYKESACLAIIDIDHFKLVNDKYGHDIGDKVLQVFSNTITHHIRKPDIFARWGGEEFTLLVPKTSKDKAISLCQKLCNTLSKKEIDPVGKVTASFGLTLISEDDILGEIIKRADKALYNAKQSGRNCVKYI